MVTQAPDVTQLDPSAGGDPQAGGTGPAGSGDEQQIRQLQAERDSLRQQLDAQAKAEADQRQKTNEQLEQTFRARIAQLPEKDRPEAELNLKTWKMQIKQEEQDRREAALQKGQEALGIYARNAYIDLQATKNGIDRAELARRVERYNVQDTEGVDDLVEMMVAAKGTSAAKSQTPAIARGRTDSAAASGGASRTYADILNDIRTRQANGERVSIKEAREEAARLGVLPPPPQRL